jgi:hypothetical protein
MPFSRTRESKSICVNVYVCIHLCCVSMIPKDTNFLGTPSAPIQKYT